MEQQQRVYNLEARIASLECLLKRTLWNLIVVRADVDGDGSDPVTEAKDLTADMAAALENATFPSVDPALSDYLAAVARDHVVRVLREMVAEMEASQE
jgi:hypothetical protein